MKCQVCQADMDDLDGYSIGLKWCPRCGTIWQTVCQPSIPTQAKSYVALRDGATALFAALDAGDRTRLSDDIHAMRLADKAEAAALAKLRAALNDPQPRE